MVQKEDIISILKKEYSTTVRVLNAYPEGKDDFRPHERSSDTMKLVSTFVFEMYLFGAYLFGDKADPTKFSGYKPENVQVAIADFKKEADDVISRLEKMEESDLNKTIEFGGKTFTGSEFAMMMIFDQIHHRGQLSVYIRMAGGKVPSIYGPSADDNSINL